MNGGLLTPDIPYSFRDGAHIDGSGRLRVSQVHSVFDSKLLHDSAPVLWDESITDGSGNAAATHSTANAAVTMHVEATDTIIRQTFMRHGYQAGKCQQVKMTGVLTAGGTGVSGEIGLSDGTDGLVFKVSGTTHSVVIRKGGSDITDVAQADWNIDNFAGDGSTGNPSGLGIDWSKGQIFVIDFLWLSLGRVRFGFMRNGRIYYCHEVDHTNSLTGAYMATPNLPLRYRIASAAGGATVEMVQICASVESEGGRQVNEGFRAASTGTAHVDANVVDTIYPLLAFRLKSTHLDAITRFVKYRVMSETNSDFRYIFSFNPTITGDALSFSNITNSPLQVAKPTNSSTIASEANLGHVMDEGFVSSDLDSVSEEFKSSLRLGAAIDGTADIACLSCMPVAGGNDDIHASVSWAEEF